MIKKSTQKPKFPKESLINWSEVSKLLTGNKENLRENRVPKKHEQDVNQLLYYVKSWKEHKQLISPDEFKEKIKNLDLLSIIMDEK